MAAHTPEELTALRATGAVHRVSVPGSGESWLVVTRDAARAALTDPRLRNDIRHSAAWETDGGHALGRNMLQSDPPQHTRLRRLVAGHFTPARTAALRARVERLACELLDALPRPGTADLVARLAAASRDPRHFPGPDRFGIGRAPGGHLGLGHGLHHRLGAPPARLEATVAVRLLLERCPALAFATVPASLTWRTGTLLRGLAELPPRLG